MPIARPEKWLPIKIALFLGAVCGAILALGGWREWQSRAADLAHAEIETRNLARSVAQYADDTVELGKMFLVGLVGRLERDGVGPEAIGRLRSLLEVRKSTLGRVRGLFVYDEHGDWIATTEKIGLAGLNNADRDYFINHKASESREILIGNPVRSRSGGQWIITISQRFNHLDGSFAGVVLATIDVAHFSEFFSRFDLGPGGAISLLSRDGIILTRYPDDGTYVGQDLSRSNLMRNIGERASEAVYYFNSPLDGRDRLSSYKVSSSFPLVALATRTQDDVLAQWKQEAWSRSIFILALVSIIAAAGGYLIRQLVQHQRLSRALSDREADFRLLAEESSDMVLRIGLDERIHYVSPSCERILGWKPGALIGSSPVARINEEDKTRVKDVIARLKSADIEEAKIIYRTRRNDDAEIWLETALRSTRSVTGELNGVVAISRDISDHIELEGQLAALARTDALTGLANRRRFDEYLELEWARAARDRTELAVILVDVDHFKKFNDQYGHPAGDIALQEVAEILDGQARRPGDLVARYGGEEFVLLLPNTDAGGAGRMAERIRNGLAKRKLPHSQNDPFGYVTVSLGIATKRPSEIHAGSEALLKNADDALYRAKALGRDRWELFVKADNVNDAELATHARRSVAGSNDAATPPFGPMTTIR
jgi:diguanylate cyclase (GGDEF)-like protein/PAS domain S-box-containing protein